MNRNFHVQIALVGGQPTPVYQGIIHLHPNQVILVCSESSEKIANDIRKQLPTYSDKDILIYKISDNDVQTMLQQAAEIEQALPKGISISLNVSGGLKPWTVLFNNIFRRKRRCCRTFFIGQDGSFFDFKSMTCETKVKFDMDAQFKILGHTIDKCTPLSDYTGEDFFVLEIIKNWGFSYNLHNPLFQLTKQFADEYSALHHNQLYRKPHSCLSKFGSLEWIPSENTFKCFFAGKEYTFSSPHVCQIMLNTGWFELYVARMIAKSYPSNQISLNCIFKNRKNTPKNEVDIIVNTGKKLIFVECKTQVFESTDVDKFNSVVKNYGGLGSKHLFVTYYKMKPESQEKCDDHNITTFYFDNQSYKSNQEKIDALQKVLSDLDNSSNFK